MLLAIGFLAATLLAACGGGDDRPGGGPGDGGTVDGGTGGATTSAVAATPGAPVVLISIDTLRSDRLPAYGYDRIETPAIDRLAGDGILYERAYSHYPLTLPAHASILTGLLPPQHGVRDNLGYRLDAGAHPNLPTALSDAGYATGGFVSAYVLEAATGMAAGFDRYDDEIDTGDARGLGQAQRPGGETLARAVAWLDEAVGGRPGSEPATGTTRANGANGAPPFFLFFHIYEPHTPYTPPEPYASRYDDPYDGEIAAADAIVGDLLAALDERGLYRPALIVLLSDHGEGLGDHGEAEHGVLLYRESLQVPLIVKLPEGGGLAGRRVAAPAALVDVMPTVLARLGIAPDSGAPLAGRPLLDLLAADAPARPIYAETWYPRRHLAWSELTSLIDGRYQLIQGPDPELYDLLDDPEQRNNLARQERRTFARLRDALEPFERELAAPGEVDEETARRLAALGYLSTGAAASAAGGGGPLPDPKGQIHLLDELSAARRLFESDRLAEAEAAFEQLTAANPGMADAWINLGISRLKQGELAGAEAAYREAIRLSGPVPALVVRLASIFRAQGRPGEAIDLLEVTAEQGVEHPTLLQQHGLALAEAGRPAEAIALLEPAAAAGSPAGGGGTGGDPALRNALAVALYQAGRLPRARQVAEGVLADDPDNAKALEILGSVLLNAGQPGQARQLLERAVTLDDDLSLAWNSLGVARQLAGDSAGALAAWGRAGELDPLLADAFYNRGLVAVNVGRRGEAVAALNHFVKIAPAERYAQELERARQLLAQLAGG